MTDDTGAPIRREIGEITSKNRPEGAQTAQASTRFCKNSLSSDCSDVLQPFIHHGPNEQSRINQIIEVVTLEKLTHDLVTTSIL